MNVNKININQSEPTYYIESGAYDVTANNNGATFASLSALLSSENLSTLIPSAVRCGGMSIRFLQSSDNKYVQYRYMESDANAAATFTDVANWQGVDEQPTVGSVNLVKSGGVANKLAELESDTNTKLDKKVDGRQDSKVFYITDTNGYIICKIDATGVHSINIDEEPNKIDNDSISIEDSNGYIIAKIDKDGIHSAKDKYAVACMVLGESYYPTAAPTRDSDGNVTYVQVIFETGVEGSISITYTNGNSSSVAVVYGDYNYTISINRDTNGNVKTVNVQ